MSRNEVIRKSPGSDRTILIVDDDASVRNVLRRWLAVEGWQCIDAKDTQTAIGILATTEPLIVVSDVNMPGRSGLWLLEQVIGRYPDISMLMLTGSNDTRTAIEALTRGALAYMLKPVQREEFFVHLRQARERRELIAERRQHMRYLEQRVHEQTIEIRQAHEETIHRLVTAAACRDEETGAHIKRTGLFSEVLAREAGWSVREAEQLRMAAPMHDVGKIGIPDAVLQKPGKLTPEEFERMKEHTTVGARMLAGSSSAVLQLAAKIALSHHERWDGKGYPQGLCGEAIPEAARIVSLVDVYDALSHDRVYRPALAAEKVLELIHEGVGTQFDPALAGLFFAAFEEIRAINELHPDEVDSPRGEFGLPTLEVIRSELPLSSAT